MKKFYAAAFCAVLTILCAAQEKDNSGLIFSANFDNFSAEADFASGKAENGSLKSDLSARKFSGVAEKGNAVCLKGSERITWSANKNFNPQQGTVSFWISPRKWNYNKKGLASFFETRFGKYLFAIYEENNYGTFSFVICTYSPKYTEIGQVRFRMPAKNWQMGVWHKIDAVWNNKMMLIYLDGVPAVKKPCNFSKAADFPATGPGRWMILGWGKKGMEDETAFDDLKIYNRVLTAAEIKSEYEKVIPAK